MKKEIERSTRYFRLLSLGRDLFLLAWLSWLARFKGVTSILKEVGKERRKGERKIKKKEKRREKERN